ncbi:MAG: GNAT family N-acetyltransferase, partial [Acidobacteria bacterium]|nr:GNAT family N-acetyltransferase [Acidobacteriota bacterium]
MKIELRDTNEDDLEVLFDFQMDEDARYLAAFMSKDSTDKAAYIKKFTRLLSEKTVNNKTIFIDNEIAGSVAKFEIEGEAGITYWIGKEFWGKGIASEALKEF